MNIKKQIILDDKDYERLVHDANLSNDEIKSKIASALTTDIVVSFDFDVNKKVTGNMRIESANLVKLYEQKQIANDVVFEMIFHPNGNLNGSWVDNEDILLAYNPYKS